MCFHANVRVGRALDHRVVRLRALGILEHDDVLDQQRALIHSADPCRGPTNSWPNPNAHKHIHLKGICQRRIHQNRIHQKRMNLACVRRLRVAYDQAVATIGLRCAHVSTALACSGRADDDQTVAHARRFPLRRFARVHCGGRADDSKPRQLACRIQVRAFSATLGIGTYFGKPCPMPLNRL